jgi:hypothetical protein
MISKHIYTPQIQDQFDLEGYFQEITLDIYICQLLFN